MLAPFRHWFTPHHTNNFRPKIIQPAGLVLLIAFTLLFNTSIRLIDSTARNILGFSSSVTIDEVVALTNERRVAEGLQPLKISSALSQAAIAKATDMFADNYWAHTAPDGRTPWDFIVGAGYRYTYAGENLAKDFGNTPQMVQAWMDSQTHRDNIVSPKYTEIGVAVVPGSLNGEDTVLVVQMFGSRTTNTASAEEGQILAQQKPAIAQEAPLVKTEDTPRVTPTPQPETVVVEEPAPQAENLVALIETKELTPKPMFEIYQVRKTVSVTTTILLMLVLLADLVVAESRKLSRRVGKNWAHLIFISFVLVLISIVNSGNIL